MPSDSWIHSTICIYFAIWTLCSKFEKGFDCAGLCDIVFIDKEPSSRVQLQQALLLKQRFTQTLPPPLHPQQLGAALPEIRTHLLQGH